MCDVRFFGCFFIVVVVVVVVSDDDDDDDGQFLIDLYHVVNM